MEGEGGGREIKREKEGGREEGRRSGRKEMERHGGKETESGGERKISRR